MFKVKDVEPKMSARKKNITISGVMIEDEQLVDEEGSIVGRLAEKLPEGINMFDLKISIEIPEVIEDEDEEYDEDIFVD